MSFALFETALVGLPASHVWRGHGSALFLEFGKLSPSSRVRRDGLVGNLSGEITLMIEWSWRIEKPRSIMGGSWSDERRWPGMLSKLQGSTVVGVRTFGALPEIEVSLSNGLRVVSFMTSEGQPEWGLICRGSMQRTLGVRGGRLVVRELTPNLTLQRTASPPA
ncbi:MAG TPA: hypothetical protein VHB46_06155 [Burkholderiales bacterium]|nr:hypothetical protein [Burkholderiales bacterium]